MYSYCIALYSDLDLILSLIILSIHCAGAKGSPEQWWYTAFRSSTPSLRDACFRHQAVLLREVQELKTSTLHLPKGSEMPPESRFESRHHIKSPCHQGFQASCLALVIVSSAASTSRACCAHPCTTCRSRNAPRKG